MAYNWNIHFDNDAHKFKIPSVYLFGGHEVNSPLYYHDLSKRTDWPHFVFQYTLRGEGCFRYDGVEHRLKPGQAFFCNAHDPKMAYYYPPEGTKAYELFFCVFSGDLELLEEFAENYGRVFDIALKSPAIQQFLDYRIRAGDHRRLIQGSQSQSIRMASLLLCEMVKSQEEKESTGQSPLIEKAQTYIFEHIEEKIKVLHLAQRLEISPAHLSRVFKEEIGLAPQKYIDQLRMQHAKQIVQTTPMSIKEISFQMGFDSPAHFNRSFKRIHGVTPGQVRKG